MKNKKAMSAVILLLVFVLILAIGMIAYKTLSAKYAPEEAPIAPPPEEELVDAPDFTVEDAEGNEVKLSDFDGKPRIVTFWATWCGNCRSEFPAFQSVYDDLGDEVELMMIDLTDGSRETKEDVLAYLSSSNYTMPVYYDTDLSAGGMYGAYAVPVSYFINSDGKIVAARRGAMSESDLRLYIETFFDVK